MQEIKLNHKRLVVFLFILSFPLATISTATACNAQEVSFYVYLEVPEKQVIADEIIYKLECLGLIVNTVYFYDLDEWAYQKAIDNPDVSYGGIWYTFFIDDIFNLAYLLYLQKNFMLAGKYEDKKFDTLVDKFTDMYFIGTDPDFVMTEEFMNEMIKTFQDIEKRLWNHKLILPIVQWVAPMDYGPYQIPVAQHTEAIATNSLPGRVFSNLALRKALCRSIDRNVFIDYYALCIPYLVYPVFHIYQTSPYHDTNLPNN